MKSYYKFQKRSLRSFILKAAIVGPFWCALPALAIEYRTPGEGGGVIKIDERHLFFILASENRRDLPGALRAALNFSRSRNSNPDAYAKMANSEWIESHFGASFRVRMPQPPNWQNIPTDSPWGYTNTLKRIVNRAYANDYMEENRKGYSTLFKLFDIFPALIPAPISKSATLLFDINPPMESLISKYTNSDIENFRLLSKAIIQQSEDDPILAGVITKMLSDNYGDRLTFAEIYAKKYTNSEKKIENSDGARTDAEKDAQSEIQSTVKESLSDIIRAVNNRSGIDEGTGKNQDAERQIKTLRDIRYKFNEAYGAYQLMMFIFQESNPDLAYKLKLYGEPTFQAGNLLISYAESAGQMGGLALVGGWASIMSSAIAAQGEQNERQQIFEQLRQVALSIEELKQLMMRKFDIIDQKLSNLLSFNIAQAENTNISLSKIGASVGQIHESIQKVAESIERNSVKIDLGKYLDLKHQIKKEARDNCVLIDAASGRGFQDIDGIQYMRCLNNLFRLLIFDSRDATLAGERVLSDSARDAVFFGSFADLADPAVNMFFRDATEMTQGRFIDGTAIPNTLPDFEVFYHLTEQLRRFFVSHGVRVPKSDAAHAAKVLDEIIFDSDQYYWGALNLFRKNSRMRSEYSTMVFRLEKTIRDTIDRYDSAMQRDRRLPFDLKTICFECAARQNAADKQPYFSDLGKEYPVIRTAELYALTHPSKFPYWSERLQIFDDFEKFYLDSKRLRSEKYSLPYYQNNEMYLDYFDIDMNTRKILNLEKIEYLHDVGSLRIYIKVSQMSKFRPGPRLSRWIDCETLEPTDEGQGKCQAGRIQGAFEILATTLPIKDVDDFNKDRKKAEWSLRDTKKMKEWVSANFGEYTTGDTERSTWSLYRGEFDSALPHSVVHGRAAYYVFEPKPEKMMNTIYRAIEKTIGNRELKTEIGFRLLNEAILSTEKRRIDVVDDIYRAIKFGSMGGSTVPEHLILTDEEMIDISSQAKRIEALYRLIQYYAILFHDTDMEEYGYRCHIRPMTILQRLDKRYLYFLPSEVPTILGQLFGTPAVSAGGDVGFCALSKGGDLDGMRKRIEDMIVSLRMVARLLEL